MFCSSHKASDHWARFPLRSHTEALCLTRDPLLPSAGLMRALPCCAPHHVLPTPPGYVPWGIPPEEDVVAGGGGGEGGRDDISHSQSQWQSSSNHISRNYIYYFAMKNSIRIIGEI